MPVMMSQAGCSSTVEARRYLPPAGIDDVFDTEGAALYIGCSPGHLKNLRNAGGGPKFTRLFRRRGIQYTRSDIDQWLSERRFGSTTEYPEHFR